MLPPATGRATITLFDSANPALFFGGTGLFVLRSASMTASAPRRWGGLALMLSFPGRLALGKTELWLDVVHSRAHGKTPCRRGRGQFKFKVTEALGRTRRHFERGCNSP